jgi:DNA mismatch endonuclease, patch repair protein
MDVLSKEQRSYCMSKIQGKNTKPELMLRECLWTFGLRYRLHVKLAGRPDIVFPGRRIAIFVDGCFWHGCPDHGVRPKSNSQFWDKKITENIQRDKRNTRQLSKEGWTVLRFWEHDIKKDLPKVLLSVLNIYDQNLKWTLKKH